ncbi:TPA_asm: Holliday junction resolvase RecU [Listeria monocytogenes]|nr:Holliday junction resolvase RecU [Listeria monocytogenes]
MKNLNTSIKSKSSKNATTRQGHANRGMQFERLIENACQIYEIKNLAIIKKLPTDWKVIRRGNQVVSAFPAQKSTVDFSGVLNPGMAVVFEAKETKQKSFPFKNIKQHQLEYLQKARKMGAHAFILINFVEVGQIYKVDIETFLALYERAVQDKRKSIPLKNFEESGEKVSTLNGIPDFLDAL